MTSKSLPRQVAFLVAILTIYLPGTVCAQEVPCEDGSVLHPYIPEGFIDGDYVLIGREPRGSVAFHGQARITSDDCLVTIVRRVGGSDTIARGGWQRLDHPKGAFALEFVSVEYDSLWSCQVSVDLDNYARLTCFRILKSAPSDAPGLEALFPTATWPESMPGKHFD